jgi:tRNA pseudouridine55 synthase
MGRRKKGEDVSGWVCLDKPEGVTSTDAVAIVRRAFNAAKAGHAGTLDPLASGILPIALGEATKTVPFLMESEKTYRFTVRWGVSTATQDREALAGFMGEIEQAPPAFSAVKVDGVRAYDLARAGETLELEARTVRVYEIGLVEASVDEATIHVRCGKGFYIRGLVRDLAAVLGVEGHVSALRRTAVGPFLADDSIGLDALADLVHKGGASERLKPVETALADIPALAIDGEDAFKLKQGRPIVLLPHVVERLTGLFRPRTIAGQDASRAAVALCEGKAVALGDVRAGRFKPTRVFQLG